MESKFSLIDIISKYNFTKTFQPCHANQEEVLMIHIPDENIIFPTEQIDL